MIWLIFFFLLVTLLQLIRLYSCLRRYWTQIVDLIKSIWFGAFVCFNVFRLIDTTCWESWSKIRHCFVYSCESSFLVVVIMATNYIYFTRFGGFLMDFRSRWIFVLSSIYRSIDQSNTRVFVDFWCLVCFGFYCSIFNIFFFNLNIFIPSILQLLIDINYFLVFDLFLIDRSTWIFKNILFCVEFLVWFPIGDNYLITWLTKRVYFSLFISL